uniref:Uncharacterized protein n=1 Tax=Fagus sylvatica TaxID=28930 RepID=A0A2N9FPW5_FAGSY
MLSICSPLFSRKWAWVCPAWTCRSRPGLADLGNPPSTTAALLAFSMNSLVVFHNDHDDVVSMPLLPNPIIPSLTLSLTTLI